MPVHAVTTATADSIHGLLPPAARRAGFAIGAVVVGVYLGLSTVAEIDPFYRQLHEARQESRYAADGWRGAVTAPPPATFPTEDRIHSLVQAVPWSPPAAAEPMEPVTSYVGADQPGAPGADAQAQAGEPLPAATTAEAGSSDTSQSDCGANGDCVADTSTTGSPQEPSTAIPVDDQAGEGPA